jgi:1-deoxy-D-xylulose-5-phosphate reductoisomerase
VIKALSVLGSTGSIGAQTLEVVRGLGNGFRIEALAAARNWEKLLEQAREFRPAAVGLIDARAADALRAAGLPAGVRLVCGADEVAALGAEAAATTVVNGITGAAGLAASLAAVRAGKTLALANKESMVMAGPLLRREAARSGAAVLPVDSEHNALFQALRAGADHEVRRLILTASGGPFRTLPRERFGEVTPAMALKHPNWDMGPKITVDSSTLMNKALEIVEARWLFDMPAHRIEVLIHPQSIIHSMVEFRDGSIIAQLGAPDMRTPIQYALTYPERAEGIGTRLDLSRALALELSPPDTDRFPSVRFGFEAARRGGVAGAVLNAANEVAVERFLAGRLSFPRIFDVVEGALADARDTGEPTLEAILEADRRARTHAAARADAP